MSYRWPSGYKISAIFTGIKETETPKPEFDAVEYSCHIGFWGLKRKKWRSYTSVINTIVTREFISDVFIGSPNEVPAIINNIKRDLRKRLFSHLIIESKKYKMLSLTCPL